MRAGKKSGYIRDSGQGKIIGDDGLGFAGDEGVGGWILWRTVHCRVSGWGFKVLWSEGLHPRLEAAKHDVKRVIFRGLKQM